jgi:3-keto-disaccharide hydrolase
VRGPPAGRYTRGMNALLVLLASLAATPHAQEAAPAKAEPWVALFNGKDLTGWTPKITGHPAGENFANTFRVEGGVLKVAYDGYGEFGGRFGHLFYAKPFSHYRLRVEYRFTGEQVPGGPGWAWRNSGVMLHGQTPESMLLAQDFPASIEVQFLGGDGTTPRTTANLCTPGTNVVMNGELVTRHCTDSSSETYHGDRWVTVEVEVRGHELVRHWIDGKAVLEYQKPQLDPNDADAQRLVAAGAKLELTGGTISLQSESHPIEFRKVEILELEPAAPR